MQVEQGKDKLQQALTEAQSQLAVSEAKVATLQASVQQAESRAAALDLQLKPKSSSDKGDSTFGQTCSNLLSVRVIPSLQSVSVARPASGFKC